MDVVEAFRACVPDNAIQKRPLANTKQDDSLEEFQWLGKRLKMG
jgi:hypothetical protein